MLKQFEKCILEGSKEMQSGRTTMIPTQHQTIFLQSQDQRIVFINSVKSLEAALFPEILTQSEIQKELNVHQEEIDEIEKTHEQILEEGFQKQKTKNQTPIQNKIIFTADIVLDKTLNKLVKIYRNRLFTLSQLLKLLNYFEEL